MQNFWDGFENRYGDMEKEAFGIPGLGALVHGAAAHVIPNVAQLGALRSPRYAKHLGKHFSEGLFNLPTSKTKSFMSGISAGVMPEHTLAANKYRNMGNDLREHLSKKLINFGEGRGYEALENIFKGDVGTARKLSPELVDSVLEFAKQNKMNPISFATEAHALYKDKSHPLLSNILPHMLQLPKRVKGSAMPKPGSFAANEANLEAAANQAHPIKRFFGSKPTEMLEDMPEKFSKKKVKMPEAAGDDTIKYTTFGRAPKEVPRGSLKRPGGRRADRKSVAIEGAEMSEDKLDAIAKNHFSVGVKIPKGLKPKEMESYIPDFGQAMSERTPQHEWARNLGAAAGTAGVAAADPIYAGVNAAKYLYFNNPRLRNFVRGKMSLVKKTEDSLTTHHLRGALEKGLVHDKALNPATNAFHRLFFSGLQGEAARSINALGRAGAKSIAPEHRKNVYNNIMGAVAGTSGAMMANPTRNGKGLIDTLKPFAVPAGVGAAGGAAAFAAGRMQRDKKPQQQYASDNVRPFVAPPHIVPQPQAAGAY